MSTMIIFKNNIKFNLKWVTDRNKLMKSILKSFDLDRDGFLNFYDYVSLRKFNNAYEILIEKEEAVYYKNFDVAVHMIAKNM